MASVTERAGSRSRQPIEHQAGMLTEVSFTNFRKTRAMLVAESKIGMSLEDYLPLCIHKDGRSLRQVKDDLGLKNHSTVRRWMQELHVPPRSRKEAMRSEELRLRTHTPTMKAKESVSLKKFWLKKLREDMGGNPEKILRRMVVEGRTTAEIASRARRSVVSIRNWMDRLGIKAIKRRAGKKQNLS